MTAQRCLANGIDATTGDYLLPPLTAGEVAFAGLRRKASYCELERMRKWMEDREVEENGKAENNRIFDGDPKKLAETGWGVIFAHDVEPGVETALHDLLQHREGQATQDRPDFFRTFHHQPGQSAADFLHENKVKPDAAADPKRGVPYYLLLVGSPESLPFQFQYELDVNYAVGRIHFEAEDDYRRYAEGVVAAERKRPRERQIALFGVRNPNDPSTEQTADDLVARIDESLREGRLDWTLDTHIGASADRACLARLLGHGETPALLFTASHGLGFPREDERQLERQGSLLCQDWPGPGAGAGVQREHYFTAADLDDDADVRGMIAFLYACYSGGTPERDNFYDDEALGKPRRIAEKPFISRLCQRLLSHPKGGALAVVGHIDRAWTSSFHGSENGEGADNYLKCLRRLLDGHTVGWAMEYFNYSHAALATQLSNRWEAQHRLEDVDLDDFADLWMASNDARNFVVFGDPAVKLAAKR